MNATIYAETAGTTSDPPVNRLVALATSLIALGVYVLTIAPDLTWANAALDGVELVTASATLGIPHPPGYPTYVILGKAFSWLPMGSVAFRYNLFSAVAIAGAAGLLVLAIGARNPRGRPAAAMTAALLFAFSPLVWSQAVVAEIYGLNLLFLAAFLFVWLRRGASFWSGLWLGLAITSHLTSLFFLPALLLGSDRRPWRPLAGVVCGLFPLLFIPLLAGGDSPIVWGQPSDIQNWWWLISGRLYGANLRPELDLEHLGNVLRMVALGPMGMLFAGQPENQITQAEDRLSVSQRPSWILMMTASFYVVFPMFYHTPDAAINMLPAFMLVALLVAPSLDRLGKAVLLLPLLLVSWTFPAQDLSGNYEVRLNAQHLLSEAPDGALLLTPGNRTIFTILYFQHIENLRPDLRVADANLFAFDWYRDRLKTQYPELYIPEGDNLASFRQFNAKTRPFCLANLVSEPGTSSVDPMADGVGIVNPPQLECE